MIRIAGLALLAGGILLSLFGINAMDSASPDIARLLTGASTDHAIWLLVGGVMMLVAGVEGLLPDSGER